MAQYKLFIVDDEQSARYGLRDCIDWHNYNIEVVGEADNGLNALEKIVGLKPDIVITDVRMPVMNGIQLSMELAQKYRNIKIVFISGYDEFEYLKTALQVEAIDYILKPINLNELHLVMQKVISKIETDNSQKNMIYQMNHKLLQSMPLLREKFLMSLVRGAFTDMNKLSEKLSFLDLKLDCKCPFCVLVLSVDDWAQSFEGISEKDRELTSFSILNICQELIESRFSGYIFENRQGEYVCLLQLDKEDDENELYSLIKDVQDNLEKLLNIKVTIGVGKKVTLLSEAVHSYRTASEAVSQKLFLGKNRVITMDSIGTYQDIIPILDIDKWQRIQLAVKTGDEPSLLECTDEIFNSLASNRSINLRYCQNISLQLLSIASSLLMDMEAAMDEGLLDIKNIWDNVFTLETIEDMRSYVANYYKKVCGLISDKRTKRSANVIDKVKDIIQKKYATNLTINEIAQEVYLASTYLCLIFKQETGETLNEYLTKVRIDKAKELLSDKNNKLYDICLAVGYTDASYFTKVFKKYAGLTPSDFRDRLV